MLAAAQRVLPERLSDYAVETVERDLTFLGLVAMVALLPPKISSTNDPLINILFHRLDPSILFSSLL